VPESHVRKKDDYTPPPKPVTTTNAKKIRSTAWVAPTMVTLLVLGLAWVVVYYLTQAELPIAALGDWNLAIGLALIAAGCVVATRWK
jgi:hypothetical protein